MKKKLLLIPFFLALIGCAGPTLPYTQFMEGDCVDRAVVLRQELRKQGYKAEIVLGVRAVDDKPEGHAWVKYKDKDNRWVNIYNY